MVKKKTVQISLDIEYYEKIKLFCERYNRKLNDTLQGVLEEFVEEIERNDPLYNTILKSGTKSDVIPLKGREKNKKIDHKELNKNASNNVVQNTKNENIKINKEEKVSSLDADNDGVKKPQPEKSLSEILLETIKK